MAGGPRDRAHELLSRAVAAAARDGLLERAPSSVGVERSKRPELGDFASNVALAAPRAAGTTPRALADAIARHLRGEGAELLADVGVAGPGFINLKFSDRFWQARLADILAAGPDWGRGAAGGPRVVLEYVSANPTGPLHFAHGRHAAFGDALARVMRFAGYDVTREFYVNDAGNQVGTLAVSIWARYMEAARERDPAVPAVPFPDNGYKGEYVRAFGRELLARDGTRWVAPAPSADLGPIQQFGIARCLEMIRATLRRFGVEFDAWQSEAALHESGDVAETLAALERAGFIDRRDDAVWLRTTALWGDDKDRVVVKSGGAPTYLLADVAYHRKKLARGFGALINVWGADHHGHIARMKAALKAFGHDPETLEVVLIQMVSLLRDGKPVAMGKREGEFVTLDDVISEVGADATRFFYLLRRHDSALEFDLELAKRQSMDNPVYYVQYAHARCAALRRRGQELQVPARRPSPELAARLTLPEEIAMLRRLADFPDFVAAAAAAREPHRLVSYAQELAAEFSSYYTRLQKVHGDAILPQERQRVGDWRERWDWERTAARLLWVQAIQTVLATALSLVGVAAPERMQRSRDDIENEGENA